MEDKILKALEQGGAMRPGDIAAAAGVDMFTIIHQLITIIQS